MEINEIPITQKNNTLAIVSLGLGLAGIPFLCMSVIFAICACVSGLTGIAAIITGYMARQQIKQTGEPGNDMALIGMIAGGIQVALVTCGVIFSLAILAMSLISRAMSN